MDDRIKLAEAMGWTDVLGEWGVRPNGDYPTERIPDPFTDANDDYAVLEWMRNRPHCKEKARFIDEIVGVPGPSGQWVYEIGDYARAALKVIDD